MLGRAPFKGGGDDRRDDDGPVIRFSAPVVPVTVDLRNADGSPRFVNGQRLACSPAAYVASTLASPILQPTAYSSSVIPTQFTGARLQWFAAQTPSTAITGAYSYPDPVLTTPSVSRSPDSK